MATRLYFGLTAPPISPTADSSWEVTSNLTRRVLERGKDADTSVSVSLETLSGSTNSNSPAGAVDVLVAQYVSAPLSGNQTISGAIKGQMRALEGVATQDSRLQTVIRVVSGNGTTVRGTLIASNASALSNEFNTSFRNVKIPLGGSTVPTSVNALDGDRIVVEIGWRKHESATTSRTAQFSSGNPDGSDLPEDETTTTAGTPWIEFADNLVFASTPTRVSQVAAQAAVDPGTSATRVSQVAVQAAVDPGTSATRVSQIAVQAAVSPDMSPTRVSQVAVQVAVLLTGLGNAADLGIDYQVIAHAGSDLGVDYAIEVADSSVGQDLEIDAGVTALATKNLSVDYAIENVVTSQAGAELDLDYQVGTTGERNADLTVRYKVTKPTKLQQRGADFKFRYKVQTNATAGRSLGVTYEILPNTGQVGADLAVDASVAINATAGPDLDINYAIEYPRGRASLDLDYEVEQPTPSAELTVDAPVRAVVDSDLEVDAAIQEVTGSELEIDASVQEAVGSDLAIDFAVHQAAGSELDITYEVEGGVQQQVGSDLAIDYRIARRRSSTGAGGFVRTDPWKFLEPIPVHADLRIDYAIAEVAAADLKSDRSISATTASTLGVAWGIARTASVDLGTTFRVMDFYEQNRQFLLAEIDPDLAAIEQL